jgi:hypothetical protein
MKQIQLNLSKLREDLIKLDGGLTVEDNALLCPNPTEFYKAAYFSFDPSDFRVVTRVKEATKIANHLFNEEILQGPDCKWNPLGSTADAKLLTPCKFSVMEEVCIWDLETSYVGDLNPQISQNDFFNHYWEVLADTIGDNIARVAWQGASYSTGFVCTGFEGRLEADGDVIDLTKGGTFSVTTVESEFEKALLALPGQISRKKSDLRFYVSPQTANLIAIAAAKNNTSNYVTRELDLFYLGIKISVQEGMSDNKIVLTKKDNLVYIVNVGNEGQNLRVTDLSVINEPSIRTRVDGHIGFDILNPKEIVYLS